MMMLQHPLKDTGFLSSLLSIHSLIRELWNWATFKQQNLGEIDPVQTAKPQITQKSL